MKNDKTTMSAEEEVYEIYNRTGYRKPDGTWMDKQKQFDYDDMIGFGEMVKQAYAKQTQPRWVSDAQIDKHTKDFEVKHGSQSFDYESFKQGAKQMRDLIFNGKQAQSVDLETGYKAGAIEQCPEQFTNYDQILKLEREAKAWVERYLSQTNTEK